MRPFDVCTRTDSLLLLLLESPIIDLSKATKLQDVVFRPRSLSVEWIATALQTTISKHRELQKITIGFPFYVTSINLDTIKRSVIYRDWLDLDLLLVQFWETRSTGSKVVCVLWMGREQDVRGYTECLLPEMTKRGALIW